MDSILVANIRKLDLGALIALQKLLAERNLSHVGREVGLSQPAMSHLLARLRTLFEDPLLVRDAVGMVLTERAERLQMQLETVVPDVMGLFDPAAFDPANATTLFKIAITDHAGQVLLPTILRRLAEAAPRVRTSIATIPNRQTDLADLDAGRYDLRIGWLRSLPPDWRTRKLLDDEIVLICATDHPALTFDLTVERFVALDFIALESEKPIYPNLVDSLLAARGITRNIVTRVSHFFMVPTLVAQTRLVAMFPKLLAQEYAAQGMIRVVTPPIDFPPNNVSVAWHPRTHNSPEHRWLRSLIVGTDGADHGE